MSELHVKDAVSVTGQAKVLDASTAILKELRQQFEEFDALVNLPVKQ